MNNLIYIEVLIDATKKKIKYLDKLIEITILQEKEAKKTPLDLEFFDEYIIQKEPLINELNDLDDGFEKIYKHVEALLKTNREQCKESIIILQSLVKEVLEKSAKLHVLENSVKISMEHVFINQKSEISKYMVSKKITKNYNSYNNNNYEESYFFDKKR